MSHNWFLPKTYTRIITTPHPSHKPKNTEFFAKNPLASTVLTKYKAHDILLAHKI